MLYNTSEEDFLNIWCDYFDLKTDYKMLKSKFSGDETLKAACNFAPGIRLLRQDKWEALCSFIISQNNNIPRIKGIINRLCEMYGKKTDFGYAFPLAETLAGLKQGDLAPIRAGFRNNFV